MYERLQEQKSKRDAEYEEAHKLKNMIKGLDDDEVEFLDLVDRTKLEEERKKNLEEEKEMRDFKAAVASLQEKSLDERLKQELKKPQVTNKNLSSSSSRNSQLKLLAGVVVKKSEKPKLSVESKGVKRKLPSPEPEKSVTNESDPHFSYPQIPNVESDSHAEDENSCLSNTTISHTGGMKCIGILPGLGSYDDSTDSDCSSDTDYDPELNQSKYDLLGRKIENVKDKEKS